MDARKRVLVVGPNRLQNELVCAYIVDSSGGEYSAGCSTTLQPAARPGQTDDTLILYDCLDAGSAAVMHGLACGELDPVPGIYTALFNLESGSGTEKVAIRHGVRGFFYRHDLPETLLKGIRAIFNNDVWASRHTIAECLQDPEDRFAAPGRAALGLTRRELDILRYLIDGATNETIATKSHISRHTVKTHLYNIYKKIGVSTRLQAARWAQEHI